MKLNDEDPTVVSAVLELSEVRDFTQIRSSIEYSVVWRVINLLLCLPIAHGGLL